MTVLDSVYSCETSGGEERVLDMAARWRTCATAVFTVIATLGLAACGGGGDSGESSGSSGEERSVTFALAVPVPDPGQVFAYVPAQAGFFEEEGLDVTFETNDGSTPAIQAVASGRADFAVSAPNTLFSGINEGFDLKAVAAIVSTSIYRVFVPSDSEIQDYADLEGADVGVSSLQSFAYGYAQQALRDAGLDPDTDVNFVTVGTGAPAYQALESGEVDALSLWDTQLALFRAQLDADLRELPPTELSDLPNDPIVVNNELLSSDPDLVAAFSRAVMKSVVFAQANPEAAAQMYLDEFPDAARGTTLEAATAALEARLANMEMRPDQKGWGWLPIEAYEEIQRIQVDLGVQPKPVDVSSVLTNELADQIQDFDPQEVAQAEG